MSPPGIRFVKKLHIARLPNKHFAHPGEIVWDSIRAKPWKHFRLGPPIFDEVTGRILARAPGGVGWQYWLTVSVQGARGDWKRCPEFDRPRPRKAAVPRPTAFFTPSHRLAAVGDVLTDRAAVQVARDFPALPRLPLVLVVYPMSEIPMRAGEWRCIDCGSVFFRVTSANAHASYHRLAWWSGKRFEISMSVDDDVAEADSNASGGAGHPKVAATH